VTWLYGALCVLVAVSVVVVVASDAWEAFTLSQAHRRRRRAQARDAEWKALLKAVNGR
jgi:hypothetical protein